MNEILQHYVARGSVVYDGQVLITCYSNSCSGIYVRGNKDGSIKPCYVGSYKKGDDYDPSR